MLTALRAAGREKVLARGCARSDAPFACPSCGHEVVLHQGAIRIHHFAHKPDDACLAFAGETEDHRLTKLALFDALRREANVQQVELEKRLGGPVADVFAVIDGVPVALEIQRSRLTVREIVARTSSYHRMGVAVLWIGIPDSDLGLSRYSPAAWERWCHAACFGRVYYWYGGQSLRPVHFGARALRVDESEWRRHGQVFVSPAYDKRSSLWRTPQPGNAVLVSQGFRKVHRPAWSGGSVQVPECTLYLDGQPNWWLNNSDLSRSRTAPPAVP